VSEFVLKPKEQELEAKQADIQFEQLPDELAGAVRAEGADQVAEALAEVRAGVAQPEALLEWMDDLRDPEEQVASEDDNLERSFTVDFIPDTARDGAATESPPGADYMFFSANRRDDSGDDDGGGGGGGGGGSGEGAGDGGGDGAGDGDNGGGGGADDKKKSASGPAKGKPGKPEGKQPAPRPAAPPTASNKKPDGK
jgi:hypothetical protein